MHVFYRDMLDFGFRVTDFQGKFVRKILHNTNTSPLDQIWKNKVWTGKFLSYLPRFLPQYFGTRHTYWYRNKVRHLP